LDPQDDLRHMIEVRIAKRLAAFSLDVDITAPATGVTALFGASGSGKTSVVQAIAGGLKPDVGRIAVDDRVFFDGGRGIDMPIHERRVGYVFQDARLFPHLSVRSNLAYGYARAKGPRRIETEAVVELLGLRDLLDRRTHRLSGGERQRVAIGRALLSQPSLLLMDEPLSSLDPPRRAELLPYIEGLRDRLGLPILYISHAFEEVVRLADHLVVMEGGRAVRTGPFLTLAADPAMTPYIGRFEAGSVLACTVAAHDDHLRMTRLAFEGGELSVPRVGVEAGTRLRVQIKARDVAISLSRPMDVSITNRLPGHLVSLTRGDGPFVEAAIDIGGPVLQALITTESASRLGLEPGLKVWALIKSVAVDGRAAGVTRGR
jgi:molybdate transport system ATP-binding protein